MVRRRRRNSAHDKEGVDLGLEKLLNGKSDSEEESFNSQTAGATSSEPVGAENDVANEGLMVSKFAQLAQDGRWQELCSYSEAEMESAIPGSLVLLESRLWWIKSQLALSGIPIGILLAPLLAVVRGVVDLKADDAVKAKERGLVVLAEELSQSLSRLFSNKGDIEAVEALQQLTAELKRWKEQDSLEQGCLGSGELGGGASVKRTEEESFEEPYYIRNRSRRAGRATSLRSLFLILIFALVLSVGIGLILYHFDYISVAENELGIIAEESSTVSWRQHATLNAPELERKPVVEEGVGISEAESERSEASQSDIKEETQVVIPRLPDAQPQNSEVATFEGGTQGSGQNADVLAGDKNEDEPVTDQHPVSVDSNSSVEVKEDKESGGAAVVSEAIPSGPERHYRIVARTFVRAEPTFRAAPIDTLFNGDRVIVVGRRGDWLKLRSAKGKEGYIIIDDAVPLEMK